MQQGKLLTAVDLVSAVGLRVVGVVWCGGGVVVLSHGECATV